MVCVFLMGVMVVKVLVMFGSSVLKIIHVI